MPENPENPRPGEHRASTKRAETPPAEDLTSKESPADLRHEIEAQAPGGWKFKLRSSSMLVGRALAWLIVVGVAIGAGYAVDRLATSLAMSPKVTLVLVTSAYSGWRRLLRH